MFPLDILSKIPDEVCIIRLKTSVGENKANQHDLLLCTAHYSTLFSQTSISTIVFFSADMYTMFRR